MNKQKILFICSRNRWRSLTAEHLFSNNDDYDVRSAGTSKAARINVNPAMIEAADLIFVMEKKHKAILEEKFPTIVDHKRIVVLHTPDEYKLRR